MAHLNSGLPALAVLGAALLLASPAFADENSPNLCARDLDAGLATARETDRPVLVYTGIDSQTFRKYVARALCAIGPEGVEGFGRIRPSTEK